MAKGKTSSASEKGRYKRYKDEQLWLKNKIARFVRILKKTPNDTDAAKALERAKNGTLKYKHGTKH